MNIQDFTTEEVNEWMERFDTEEVSDEAWSTLRVLLAFYGPDNGVLLGGLLRLSMSGEVPQDVADECFDLLTVAQGLQMVGVE